jgi:hypothetical protein
MSEYDELAGRVAKLEAELAEAKKALEAGKPKEPFKPSRHYTPIDWTAGFKLPPDAAQKMAAVVPDVKGEKWDPVRQEHAWSQTRMYEPGGFGPLKDRMTTAEQETRRRNAEARKTAEPQPAKDTRSPQTRIFDAMVAHMVGGPNEPVK